jgi:hypothetical protein
MAAPTVGRQTLKLPYARVVFTHHDGVIYPALWIAGRAPLTVTLPRHAMGARISPKSIKHRHGRA